MVATSVQGSGNNRAGVRLVAIEPTFTACKEYVFPKSLALDNDIVWRSA